MNVTPSAPVREWRLRGRNGAPRAIVETVAQFVWRWRIELGIAYLIATVSAAALVELGIL